MLDLEFLAPIYAEVQEKAFECLKYSKTIWQPGLCPGPTAGGGGAYSAIFHNLLSTASTL